MLAMIFIGTFGYVIIEDFPFFDAFYMTILTVATVGFGEVHQLSNAGRLFTSFLIIFSFGTFAYAVSTITQYLADGEFNRYFKNYKVTTAIEKLSDHVIVCGYGRNGKQAVTVLKNNDTPYVVIEEKKEVVNSFNEDFKDLIIEGDATLDEILIKAGIHKAKALITSLPIDADNLFIVLSARQLNNTLTIISRASDDNTDKKLKAAGANNVIMPDKIGGAHMASLVLKPDVVEFVDNLTGQNGLTQNLAELTFEAIPEVYRNKTIKELEVRNKTGANIIGFKTVSGEYVINPSPDTKIIPGAKIFVLGTIEQISLLKQIFNS